MKSPAALALLALSAACVSPALATVTISTGKTKNMTCEDGACAPTSRVASLSTADLANMLAAGDAKVFTGNGPRSIRSGDLGAVARHQQRLPVSDRQSAAIGAI